MNRFTCLVFLIAIATVSYSQKVSISLFNSHQSQTFVLTPVSGKYSVVAGDQSIPLTLNQILYVSRKGDSVMVRDMTTNFGVWPRVSIIGETDNDAMRINSVVPSFPARVYDENLTFYVDFNRLMTLNVVDLDKYIAGVVEAEAGPNAHAEFYKAQSILARTYALGHSHRHSGEGFNLCDEVHCQVYKGRGTQQNKILQAVRDTKGIVAMDKDGELIVSAFHGNCGGETANSGDVWVTNQPYLVSIHDNFCRNLPSSQWEVRITKENWLQFLELKGVETDKLSINDLFSISRNRTYHYEVGGKKIPMTEIRSYFNLRSAFFSVDMVSGVIRIKGKGYGHGVGMCQDGAMQMAKRGRKYTEIINFYFQGVSLVNYFEDVKEELDEALIEKSVEEIFEEEFNLFDL